MSQNRVLIVHPEESIRALLSSMLQTMGCRIDEAPNDRVAVRKLEQEPTDLVLSACDPADPDALELLAYLHRKHPAARCVLLFSSQDPDRVREALNWGAASVLRFPLPANHLRAAVAQAMGLTESRPATPKPTASNGSYVAVAKPEPPRAVVCHSNGYTPHHEPVALADFAGLVGQDTNLRQAVELAASIAGTRAPVLLIGEPGTGKTLLARTIHRHSNRREGPLVELECADNRVDVLEVELFGQVLPDGRLRPGKLAHAQGGTLYIHEVAALSPSLQARLLRVIQEGEFEPVGSARPAKADVRFVLASREDLVSLVERDQFRADLYYRISVVSLNLPPLRHRGDDIARLAEHFRARFAREIGRPVSGFTPEAVDMLRHHDWPGNVLELENVVERAVVHCWGPRIDATHLELHSVRPERPIVRQVAPPVPSGRPSAAGILPLKEALEIPERQLILQALEALNWNRQETARVLDINRTTLYKKMKKYGLLFDEPVWAN